ncbi:nitroreductase family protein [Massilia arenae]|uniref:Putative NAD(P)H nitroreductase n=1 Tax=Massilia arenae TaxID=2603288 RepID=A0A5C7FZI1_9BURK|nr:nitroreductase family protein [Massilia arenae]TXG00869.1 nitroreductase [Massilia arenae]
MNIPESDAGGDFQALVAARRNFTLRRLHAPGPDAQALERMVEAAAHAPDHGLLRPWRFVLIPQERRADLGEVFAEALAERDPGCGEEALATARDKAQRAPCLLVAVLRDDTAAKAIPVAEKLVSLGCALQNLLLAAGAAGFATGLASGAAMDAPGMRRLLRLEAHERAICFIGLGTAGIEKPPRPRPDAADYLSSI